MLARLSVGFNPNSDWMPKVKVGNPWNPWNTVVVWYQCTWNPWNTMVVWYQCFWNTMV